MDNKQFYKSVFFLVLPMALQNLINVGISSTDVIMLGRIGEKTLSGASLGSQVFFILSLFLFGITSGGAVLIAQYWGKGDLPTIQKIFGIEMKYALLVSFVFMTATFAFANPIMHIFTNDPEVAAEGVSYLHIVCFSYVLSAITMVYLNTMRSMEHVVIATLVYLCSLVINIVANYIFIFTPLNMGIRGAAWGTLIARTVELLIVILYDKKYNPTCQFHFSYFRLHDKLISKDFSRYSLPVIANEVAWGLGTSCISAIIGHLGSAATAANSVTQVTRQLAMVVTFGIANATAIMIGKTIGEGNQERARQYGQKFLKLAIITGCIGAVIVLIIRPLSIHFMVLTPLASEYLSRMMLVMSYFVIGQAINTVLVVGVFRAGGDTRFGLFLDTSFMWGISILLGFIAAFALKLPVIIVYIILLSDEILKIPVCIYRYQSLKWLKNITK